MATASTVTWIRKPRVGVRPSRKYVVRPEIGPVRFR
jgi:hypothetical protein